MVYRERRSDGTVLLTGSGLQAYPIGALYFSAVPVDPGAIFGGTWERFAKGRMIVGVDEVDPDFATPLLAGGSKSHILGAANLPPHTHGSGSYQANIGRRAAAGTTGAVAMGAGLVQSDLNANIIGTSADGPGTSAPVDHKNPFVTVYIYRRTA